MNRFVTFIALFCAVLLTATAQTTLESTVPGDGLRWETNALRLAISVTEASDVKLGVYSPGFDPDDYRSAGQLGDERYDGADTDLTANFTLSQNGESVSSSSFGIEPHGDSVLFEGRLEPGEYILTSDFAGFAKNTFVYTLNALEASVFIEVLETQLYNIERGDFQTAFTLEVPSDEVPMTVEFYDGDGAAELVGRMKLPNGSYTDLSISEDRAWSSLALSEPGSYDFEFYVPDSAFQFSNTIGMRVDKRLEIRDGGFVAVTPEPEFSLDKSVDIAEATPGDTLTYTIVVENTGGALGAANLEDVLPEFLEGPDLNESFDLPAGASRTFSLEATVLDGAPAQLTNEAMLVSEVGVLTDSATVSVQQPEPEPTEPASFNIQKTATVAAAQPGDTVGFSLTVTNTGGTAGRVALADTLPRGLDGSFETQSLTLEPGETRVFELETLVREDAPDKLINYATIVTSKGRTFTRQRAEAEVDVLRDETPVETEAGEARFVLTKRAVPASAQPGDSVDFLLDVTNVGDVAGSVTVTDPLPAGLVGDTLDTTLELAPGDSRRLFVSATVTEDAPALIVNKAYAGTGAEQIVASAFLRVTRAEAAELPEFELRRFSRVILDYQADNVLSCELGSFAPGEVKTVGIRYRGRAGETLFERSVNAEGLMLEALPPSSLDNATEYRVRLTNTSDERLRDVFLTEPLPLGAELLDASYVCTNVLLEATALLLTHVPPEGATFEPGSVLVGGEATPDPYRDEDGRLYFVLPPAASGLSYLVAHADSLGALAEPSLTLRAGGQDVFLVDRIPFGAVPAELGVTPVRPVVASGIEVRPLQAVADGSSPLQFELRALQEGLLVDSGFITVDSSLEPVGEDDSADLPGFQVALVDRVGRLELSPQTSGVTLELSLALSSDEALGFELREDLSLLIPLARTGLYQYGASATLTTAGGVNVALDARGYAELPVGPGTLQVAADAGYDLEDGLDTERGLSDAFEADDRFPLTGAGLEAAPALRSDDGIAAKYTQNDFSVGYYADSLGVPGVDSLPRATALQAEADLSVGGADVNAEGFVALLPEATRSADITPDGTRIYSLGEAVTPQSERALLLTADGEIVLERLRDYSIDYVTGLVTLAEPLQPLDADFNPVTLRVAYAPEGGSRSLVAYGVGARYRADNLSFALGAAVLDDIRAGADVVYAGDDLGAGLSYHVTFGEADLSQRVTARADGGLDRFEFGVNLTYDDSVTDRVRGTARVAYRVFENGRIALVHEGSLGSNRTGLQYEQSLDNFVLGAGLDYLWEQSALAGAGLVGYAGERLDVSVRHSQPFDLEQRSRSSLQAGYQVNDNLAARLGVAYQWGNDLEGTVGLVQDLGGANLSLDYDLPTLSGEGNRARFGVSAPFKLTDELSLNASAGYSVSLAEEGLGEASFGTAARYRLPNFTATLGAEVALPEEADTKLTLRAGAAGQLTPDSQLAFDANAIITPEFSGSFTAAYSLKAGGLNLLTYHRLKRVAEATLLEGEVAPTYVFSDNFQLRPNLAYRLNFDDTDASAYQGSLFGTYTFDLSLGGADQAELIPYTQPYRPTLGLGAGAVYLLQPGLEAGRLGFAVEGSVQIIDPVWVTAGYLFDNDFGGLTPSTQGGFYLRLDVLGSGQF